MAEVDNLKMNATARSRLMGGLMAMLGGAAVLAALGIGSGPEAWGARTIPILAGLVMVAAGFAIMFERSSPGGQGTNGSTHEIRALGLTLIAGAYILLVGLVGYLTATFVAAPIFLRFFGMTSRRRLLAGAVFCPIALHLLFFQILGVFPPRAAWFDLADSLPF